VNLDAVTANALTVVGVRVCRCVAVTVVLLACGVPPVARVDVVEDPRDDLPEDPPEDEPPEDEPPEDEPPEDEPPEDEPLEDEPREPLEDEPAPADPDPERRAILSAPH